MFGGQLGYASPSDRTWAFDAHAAYYHCDRGSLAGADAGDFRSNLRNPDGTYVSDFHLVDAILGVTWKGLDPQWPMRLTLDYVTTLGAEVDADPGSSADHHLGKASATGDWPFTWGFALAQHATVLADAPRAN